MFKQSRFLISMAIILTIAGMMAAPASASQHDMNIANAAGATVRADINDALEALATNNSGAAEPSYTFANMWWFDTSNNLLKIRNAANNAWITVAAKNGNDWTPYRLGTAIGDVAILTKDTDGALTANSDSKVATQKATKTYADLKIPLTYLDTDGALAANSDSKVATQKATKTYTDGKFNTSTGHDHDGSDSKKVLATNLDITGIDDGDFLKRDGSAIVGASPVPAGGGENHAYLGYEYPNTELMLHFEGADESTTFTDESLVTKTVTKSGNAKIDSAQYKFGSTSGYFDGTGDYLTIDTSSRLIIGTGSFTIDFWIRPSSVTGYHNLIQTSASATANDILIRLNGNKVQAYIGSTQLDQSDTLSVNTWYHVAIVRNGTALVLYVGGASKDSDTSSDNITNQILNVSGSASGSCYAGWMDEMRVAVGEAKWTTTFTAPSEAHAPELGWYIPQ